MYSLYKTLDTPVWAFSETGRPFFFKCSASSGVIHQQLDCQAACHPP